MQKIKNRAVFTRGKMTEMKRCPKVTKLCGMKNLGIKHAA